jgi:hypothetical protein
MKYLSRTFVLASLVAFSGQSLAMDTRIERSGMLYAKVPLTKKFMRTNETAIGFRFGQARFSTDSYGSLLSSFKTHPGMIEMEFRPTGRIGDISFKLQEFKLNGISSLEKKYINGGMGFIVAPAATAVLTGIGAVGAIGLMAASSSDSDDDKDDSPDSKDSSSSKSTNDDDVNDDKHDDSSDHVAGHDDYPNGYHDDDDYPEGYDDDHDDDYPEGYAEYEDDHDDDDYPEGYDDDHDDHGSDYKS